MTRSPDETVDDEFGPSGMRLDLREWLIVIIIVTLVVWIVPPYLSYREGFEPATGYRVPYLQSEDYWHYERWCERAKETHDVVVLGDSVVWGEYVAPGRSLASQLSRVHGPRSFANLGVNGLHPAALAGLLEHHGGAIADTSVVLHCNLLWMSAPKPDLSGEDEYAFHHARLVPQLLTRIPCYRATETERIEIAIERHIDYFNWVRHERITRLDGLDLHSWTLDHPTIAEPHRDAVSWTERGLSVSDFDWVAASKSFQWRRFQRCVEILRARGNRLLIVVGPFNEHMLSETGLAGYRALKADVEAWFEREGVDHVSPAVLPSEMYADASHPLEAGYARLAESIRFQ
jgi:hypothetical protein